MHSQDLKVQIFADVPSQGNATHPDDGMVWEVLSELSYLSERDSSVRIARESSQMFPEGNGWHPLATPVLEHESVGEGIGGNDDDSSLRRSQAPDHLGDLR